jgi:hypothetical protein
MLPGGSFYVPTLCLQRQSEKDSKRNPATEAMKSENGGEAWRRSQILGAFPPAPSFLDEEDCYQNG